ncbi:hypothetical protein BH23GEM3_BH23GEM3_25120 [soil metagenome]|nr:DUF309 domain-containing protein [Gemmatimonadota bacterium]
MHILIPSALQRFVDLFNRAAYWESHEVLERPWRTGRSDFYKGLILYASAWVHVQRGNPRGIAAQLRKAERQLEAFRPAYLGVDVDALLAHAAVALQTVLEHEGAAWHKWEAVLPAPRLELRAERIRGNEAELAEGE